MEDANPAKKVTTHNHLCLIGCQTATPLCNSLQLSFFFFVKKVGKTSFTALFENHLLLLPSPNMRRLQRHGSHPRKGNVTYVEEILKRMPYQKHHRVMMILLEFLFDAVLAQFLNSFNHTLRQCHVGKVIACVCMCVCVLKGKQRV